MNGALPRHARGKRPRFHDDDAIDRLITIILTLTSEISVLRDRLDTVEMLGEKAGWLGVGVVDDFVADQPTRERREAAREAYLGRVLHILNAEVEGLQRDEDYWSAVNRIERGDD